MKLAALCCMLVFFGVNNVDADVCDYSYSKLLEQGTVSAAALYFSKHESSSDEGFTDIDPDDIWLPHELFERQYGPEASSASFTAAINQLIDVNSASNVSMNRVLQLMDLQSFRQARTVFGSILLRSAREMDLVDEDGVVCDWMSVLEFFKVSFASIAALSTSPSGDDSKYGSFLNLELGSSMSFVMDDTGSMGGEIDVLKALVVDIILDTQGTNSEPLAYVLVPFNDPDVGPVTKTTDPDEFINAVNALYAHGGGDTPELAMEGILKAGHASGRGSIIYVFTDAPEKDTPLQYQVIAICLLKKLQVHIYLTQNIARRKRSDPTGRSLYQRIASATGGQVMQVDKANVPEASRISKATTQQGLVLLKSLNDINDSRVDVFVDSTISSLLVQVTGDFSAVALSLGGSPDDALSPEVLTNIPGLVLLSISNITAGSYVIDISDVSSVSVVVRGTSPVGIHSSLKQKRRGTDIFDSSRQLRAGVETKLSISTFGNPFHVEYTHARLINRHGVAIVENLLSQISESHYDIPMFLLPNEPMLVEVLGVMHDGEEIHRIDPCAITPTEARSYFDDIASVALRAGESITITAVFHNLGVTDTFDLTVSDAEEYSSISGAVRVVIDQDASYEITLTISASADARNGILSQGVLVADTLEYYVFTTFEVEIIDDVVRCESPAVPPGGELHCAPDAFSVGSICVLTCGSEYRLLNPVEMQCREDGTWSHESAGECEYLGSSTCSLSGDPHYVTFDGERYDFMGACLYVLVEVDHPDVESVTISTENQQFAGQTHVSYFKQAFITMYNITLFVKEGGVVLLDGITINLPASLQNGKIRVTPLGSQLQITTDFGMEVIYNGAYTFSVTLPASYMDKVSGLCGRYNGIPDDDFMIGNLTFPSYADFGNYLEIVGGAHESCRKGNPDDDDLGCENEALEALFQEKCAFLKSYCFEDCFTEERRQNAFEDCVYDMCASQGNDESLAQSIATFADECQANGVGICDWRGELNLPLTCHANSHYEANGNPCHNLCVDREAFRRCLTRPTREGCYCNDGYYLSGEECVPVSECGCTTFVDSNARYFLSGQQIVSSDCTEQCTCIDGEMVCNPMGCAEGSECRLSSGVYSCQPSQIDLCYATGDPHYLTLDGNYYDFMGQCEYVMAQSDGLPLDHPNFIHITAQNEYRYGSVHVSYVRHVTIEYAGCTFQMGPGYEFTANCGGMMMDIDQSWTPASNAFLVQKSGSTLDFRTYEGLQVQFSHTMNLHIWMPSFYMRKVSGLCGNYTGEASDDFGGMDLLDFISEYLVGDSCEENEDLEPFVCPDEDHAVWASEDYCGMLSKPDGPFVRCNDIIDPAPFIDECAFDLCATEGNMEVLTASFAKYAEACKGDEVPLCTWEVDCGMQPECPEHSTYQGCASFCENTCQNTKAVSRCELEGTVGACVCDFGYLMMGGKCIKANQCGCTMDGVYVEQQTTTYTDECAQRKTCIGPSQVEIEEDPCTEQETCEVDALSKWSCQPKEYKYLLLYGDPHVKTFDGRFFDFVGDCAYTLVRYDASDDMPGVPSFEIIGINERRRVVSDLTALKETVVVIWDGPQQHVIRLKKGKMVLINGVMSSMSMEAPRGLMVKRILEMVTISFDFGLIVNYDGDAWLRIDVTPEFNGKLRGLGGNYNLDPSDDMFAYKIEMDPRSFGDYWRSELYSDEKCSIETIEIDHPCDGSLLRSRFERSCDCGVIRDVDGPFAACHMLMDPEPFFENCLFDACAHNGDPVAMASSIWAYSIACIGKGVTPGSWRDLVMIPESCPENSHFESCASPCQPMCLMPPPELCPTECNEACICDEGYILSEGECVLENHCGCTSEAGLYVEHGVCIYNMDCTLESTCINGEYNEESHACANGQYCGVRDGVHGCHWFDECKYDNGGCSDICRFVNGTKACACPVDSWLMDDMMTCAPIPSSFYSADTSLCGSVFNAWKVQFLEWHNVQFPLWKAELEAYKLYVKKGLISTGMSVCEYEWTEWLDRDNGGGCGDEETLDLLRADDPDSVCETPIAAEARMADGRRIGAVIANFDVNAKMGLVCKNAEQDGIECPDFAVRFLCPVMKMSVGNDTMMDPVDCDGPLK